MTQCFRSHRLFQLLSWIDTLSRGYDAPDNRRHPADGPLLDEPHRPPTASNLAYYLLTDAEYNRETLEDRFSRRAIRGPPDRDVFTHVKRDLTRHLTQYPGDLFTAESVRKTATHHPTFDVGLESRHVEAKAYYLTERGRTRLEKLTKTMRFKRDLLTTRSTIKHKSKLVRFEKEKHVLTEDALDRIDGTVDSKPIKTDSITVPIVKPYKWKLKTYQLPHVAVEDAERNRAPTIYRD